MHVPAFGGAVWRGCRHMATPYPRSRGVQTSQGIALARVDGAWLLVSARIPRAQGRPSWSPWHQSQAGSGAGCRLPLPTVGHCSLEHREDVKRMKMFCSPPAMTLAGSAGGVDGSCRTRTRYCDEPWVMPSHGKCLSILLGTWEPANALCTWNPQCVLGDTG